MREPGLHLPTDLLIWELAQPSVTGGLATRGGGLDPLQLRPHSPPDVRQPLDTQMSHVPSSGRPETAILSWPAGMGWLQAPFCSKEKVW